MNTPTLMSFFKRNKSFLFIIGIFLGFFLLGSESLFAANSEPVLSQEDSESVVRILNGIITGAAALMGMITSFITMFLYPGWVNGTLFGLQEYLKEMWILVSNIVYFIFAFILIAIAFMNIIGKGEGTWELKQAMPKFIIGVLIVPFSWFFVQFLLSISAVLTVGVLTLPYNSFGDHDLFKKALENKEFAGKEICKDVIISFNGDFSGVGGVGNTTQLGEDENDLDENIKCRDGGKIKISELITGKNDDGSDSQDAKGLQNSIFGIISIYSYGILSIDKIDEIHAHQLKSVKTISDLIFKIVFDVLFIVVYLLLMVALLLALFVRGIRLWIYMMLSPAFGLLYFFGKGSEGVGESGDKFNVKEFIALALVPVYVSAALAFGLLFILVASEGINKDSEDKNTLEAGGFSLTILGAHGDGKSEKSVIGKLIVEIFGVVILWIAVMAALGASKTTKAVVEPIAAFGKSVGELAAKAPTYAPIIPTGDGKPGLSAAGIGQLGQSIKSGYANQATNRGSEFAKGFLPGSAGPQVDLSNRSQQALETLSTSGLDSPESWNKFRQAMQKGNSTEELSRNEDFVKLVKAMLEQAGKSDEADQIRVGDRASIARGLGELDSIGYLKNQDVLGGLGTKFTSTSHTADDIDSILANNGTYDRDGSGSDTETSTTPTNNNTVNVEIGGDTVTVQEAIQRMGEDTRAGLDTKLSGEVSAGRITNQHKTAIMVAFDTMDADGDSSIDASSGGDD